MAIQYNQVASKGPVSLSSRSKPVDAPSLLNCGVGEVNVWSAQLPSTALVRVWSVRGSVLSLTVCFDGLAEDSRSKKKHIFVDILTVAYCCNARFSNFQLAKKKSEKERRMIRYFPSLKSGSSFPNPCTPVQTKLLMSKHSLIIPTSCPQFG